jgi:hypothetical protein
MHPSFTPDNSRFRALLRPALGVLTLLAGVLLAAALCSASEPAANSIPNIFAPRSTPADSIRHFAGNSTLAKRFNGAAMAHPSISFSRHLAVRLPRRISRVL